MLGIYYGTVQSKKINVLDIASLAGLKLWLDSSDLSTITEASGRVSQWDDKSGEGNHLIQGTASAQPYTNNRTQNGKNVIDFQGGNWLKLASISPAITQAFTIYLVAKIDVLGSYLLDGDGGANRVLLAHFITDFIMHAGASIGDKTRDTDLHLFKLEFDGVNSNLIIDQVNAGSGDSGSNSLDGLTVGARYSNASTLDGFVAEMIVISGLVSAQDDTDINNYLTEYWGL